mgnify:CR=1 FL=1
MVGFWVQVQGARPRQWLVLSPACNKRPVAANIWCCLPQVVLEGPVVNTAGTGPAAAMALMMMYLKTGDAGVAARFKV